MSGTKVLIPISNNFEEIELIAVLDILRRAKFDVTLASVLQQHSNYMVKGQQNIMIKCDDYFDNVASESFDLILLVGEQGNSEDLSKCSTLIELLKKQKKNNRYLLQNQVFGRYLLSVCVGAATERTDRKRSGHYQPPLLQVLGKPGQSARQSGRLPQTHHQSGTRNCNGIRNQNCRVASRLQHCPINGQKPIA